MHSESKHLKKILNLKHWRLAFSLSSFWFKMELLHQGITVAKRILGRGRGLMSCIKWPTRSRGKKRTKSRICYLVCTDWQFGQWIGLGKGKDKIWPSYVHNRCITVGAALLQLYLWRAFVNAFVKFGSPGAKRTLIWHTKAGSMHCFQRKQHMFRLWISSATHSSGV